MAQEDTVALCTGGYALTWVAGQLDADTALIDRALALDPNLAAAWHLSDWVRLLPARIEHMARATRRSNCIPIVSPINGVSLAPRT